MLQTLRSNSKIILGITLVLFIVVFVFTETSGLTERPVTLGTAVGEVNGREITYDTWSRAYQSLQEQMRRQRGSLTQDDLQRLETEAFNQIVDDVLLQAELNRRGISVTDDEIRLAADNYPPPWITQSPELQTEGRFDMDKYRRYLRSPVAADLRLALEQYYRSEIPRQKLNQLLATGVWASDEQLWQIWRDSHDSARVSFVALRPELIADSAVQVTDADLRAYFSRHEKEFEDRPGRAVVSLVMIPRPLTAADSAATRERLLALKSEIVAGTSTFEDVVRRESADTASHENGGLYEGVHKDASFVDPFKNAALALRPGEWSEPVLTTFGYHILRAEKRRGDTVDVRHILLRVEQTDSLASRLAKRADSLQTLAGSTEPNPARFDSAARRLELPVGRAVAIEGEPLFWNGRPVPDVSAWAFAGTRVGEVSHLVDADDAYYMARLDSLVSGGKPTVELLRDDLRRAVLREKKLELLVPRAQQVAAAVAGGQTLEQAAQANGLKVDTTPLFSRVSPVLGLGRFNEAIGAAFSLPVNAVSAPVKTQSAVVLLRVDERKPADRAAFEAQKATQREQVVNQLRQQRVQQFLANLREEATVENNVRAVQARARGATTGA